MTTLLRWIPAIAYATAIALLSSSPRPLPIALPFAGFDKLLHLAEYAPLALLVRWALASVSAAAIARRATTATVAAVGLFGLTDELHQSIVPGRSADALDVVADCAGALVGVALWHWIAQHRRGRGESHAA